MNYAKIGKIEAIAFIVIIVLNHIVLYLPKSLLDACSSATPLNIIYVSILAFIVLYIVIKLFKNFSNNDIIDISEFLGGKVLRNIIGIIFVAYFTITSATLLRNFAENLKLIYFPKTHICVLIILFIGIAAIANKIGSNAVTKINILIVPLVMINLLIAYFAVFKRFVPQRIFPILGYGANETFLSGASNIFAFSGLAYMYFLQPLLKKKEDFKLVTFTSLGISSIYVFLSVTCLLFSFADILTINEISPIYLLVRGTSWGRFIQRPDAVFFMGWMLALMSYLSINIMLISGIFKKIGNLSAKSPLIYSISSIIFIVSLIPHEIAQIRFVENVIFKYFTILFIYISCVLILLFANIKYKHLHKQGNKESDLENAK